MTEKTRLLVIEDHIGLSQNLSEFFDRDRYAIDFAVDADAGLALLADNPYDVLVLDIMLPGISGLELCRIIRHDLENPVPIIMMTARDQLADKEDGFGFGADDYLTKPFHLRELQLRIDALHRRRSGRRMQALHNGPVTFDPGTLKVTVKNSGELALSGLAAEIFEALMREYPDYLSHATLQEKIWGRFTDVHTMRTHVYSLRKQFQNTFGSPLIRTLHGKGYQLQLPGETP